jgi:hypothetical protein
VRKSPLKIGDEVVHQSHPGRFTVVRIEPRPAMNVYSDIITIRSADGVEMKVLDTTVRTLAAAAPRPES